MKRRAVLFILGLLIWIIITFSLDWGHLLIGIAVSLLIAYLAGDLFTARPHLFSHISRYLWFLYYIPIFLWECLKANIEVACKVLHPKCPIVPGIVKVKTSLKSETALTFLANSITLTPGTLTVDLDQKEGVLYIHWIDVSTQDCQEATRRIVYRFERILSRIFE
ncbi:MAG: Na+/H+ antiporter subunit E [Candidatus Omnitrophota bacterium]